MTTGRGCGLILAMLGALTCSAPAQETGLRAPRGFSVEPFAGDELAHDIYAMTLDARGRVVVAGRGYIKTLHDDDGDGRADRSTVFSEIPRAGAHGMAFDGDDLICTGDDAVMRLRDADGDGRADGAPDIWARLKNPEHGANGVVLGPDGWFYVICGNDAGVSVEQVRTERSPIVRPECGAVVRFSPDGRRSEVVAHGFRNPYDCDFDGMGRLFTVDSDGERDQYLPWYSPTRLFDIAIGQHHGWVQRGWQHSWNRPETLFDSGERLAEAGRGSPTGLAVYRHRAFPARYFDGVFSCCWTLGRVYFFPLTAAGSSYSTQREIFLETTGETGFAPVDLAVGRAGELYVAIGGRQTRGGVFRVRYSGVASASAEAPSDVEATVAADLPALDPDLAAVLRADQPSAAWSRAVWRPVARRLGFVPFAAAALNERLPDRDRLRALETLAELQGGVSVELAEQLLRGGAPSVTARAVALLSADASTPAVARLLRAAVEPAREAGVRRAGWEAMLRYAFPADAPPFAWESVWAETASRRLRNAALRAAEPYVPPPLGERPANLERLARRRLERARDPRAPADEALLRAIADEVRGGTPAGRLEAIRVAQLELGDIRSTPVDPPVDAGYVSVRPEALPPGAARSAFERSLADGFPTGDLAVDRELARLLGMLEVDDAALVDRCAALAGDSTSVEDDLHFLIVMSRLPGARSASTTAATARTLTGLHRKMREGRFTPSRNWPARTGEMFARLLTLDADLGRTLVEAESFGRGEHSLFARRLTGELRLEAARRLARAAQADEDVEWSPELVETIGELPGDESLELLRSRWSDFALRDAVAIVLARQARPADRGRLTEALGSVQPGVVEKAAEALAKIGGEGADDELAAALQALRQAGLAKEQRAPRAALHRLLETWTTARLDSAGFDSTPTAAGEAWAAWMRKERPEAARRAAGFGGADSADWLARLDRIAWEQGDVERGRASFEKRACARCHRAADRLGPDLTGAAGRFAREDLFAAIVDPSRNVAPLYQTTQIVTRSGKVYQGLVIYESPEGTLLQTTPDDTIRITGDEITVMRKSRQSLMPAGLLNSADDGELADLYAYLKTLRNSR